MSETRTVVTYSHFWDCVRGLCARCISIIPEEANSRSLASSHRDLREPLQQMHRDLQKLLSFRNKQKMQDPLHLFSGLPQPRPRELELELTAQQLTDWFSVQPHMQHSVPKKLVCKTEDNKGCKDLRTWLSPAASLLPTLSNSPHPACKDLKICLRILFIELNLAALPIDLSSVFSVITMFGTGLELFEDLLQDRWDAAKGQIWEQLHCRATIMVIRASIFAWEPRYADFSADILPYAYKSEGRICTIAFWRPTLNTLLKNLDIYKGKNSDGENLSTLVSTVRALVGRMESGKQLPNAQDQLSLLAYCTKFARQPWS